MNKFTHWITVIILLFTGILYAQQSSSQNSFRSFNLQANIISDYSVKLTWNPINDSEITYQLQRQTGPNGYFVSICNIQSTLTSLIDSSLIIDVMYGYRLKLSQAPNGREYSNVIFVRTELIPDTLKLKPLSDHEIMINCRVEDGIEAVIQRQIQSVFRTIGTISTKTPTLIDSTLKSGSIYYYRVKRASSHNKSIWSMPDSIFVPFDPPLIQDIRSISPGCVELEIEDQTRFADGAILSRSVNRNWIVLDTVRYKPEQTTRKLTIRDSLTQPNIEYGYKVVNMTGYNLSDPSPVCYYRTMLPSPFDFHSDSLHDRIVQLSWKDTTEWIVKFLLERSQSDGIWEEIAELRDSSYVDSTVNYGTEYRYRVRGVTSDRFLSPAKEITETIVRPPMPMILIKGGKWNWGAYGEEYSMDNLSDSHFVAEFLIDKFELSMQEYLEFCNQTDYPKPPSGFVISSSQIDYSYEVDKHLYQPITGVSWNDAIEFCNWRSNIYGLPPAYDTQGDLIAGSYGYRLPTEAEVQRAIQIDTIFFKNLIHNEFPSSVNLWRSYETKESFLQADYYRNSDRSVQHLVGNVWEWCSDPFTLIDQYQSNPIQSNQAIDDKIKVVCGGGFTTPAQFASEPLRYGSNMHSRSRTVGFRCARSLFQKE